MPLIKCPDCEKDVSDSAVSCPNCGHPINIQSQIQTIDKQTKKTKSSLGGYLLAIIILIIVLWIVGSISSNRPPISTALSVSPRATEDLEPKLELVKSNWHTEYGYAIYDGQVRNITTEPLKNVTAVVSFYDKQQNFITSSEAIIQFNPILPNQKSPFKVMQTENPAMKLANVEFKYLMGGTIPHKEPETKKKK
jgi:hypothetical protein